MLGVGPPILSIALPSETMPYSSLKDILNRTLFPRVDNADTM